MALDYTMIINVRQHFGSDSNAFEETAENQAPFVGAAKDFQFSCPDVDSQAGGILLFQSFGVSHRSNQLEVNGDIVFGGIARSADFVVPRESVIEVAIWHAHVLLVSAGSLRENNTLHIESRNQDGGTGGRLDDFIIDNAVVLFKTRQSQGPVIGTRGTTGEVSPA